MTWNYKIYHSIIRYNAHPFVWVNYPRYIFSIFRLMNSFLLICELFFKGNMEMDITHFLESFISLSILNILLWTEHQAKEHNTWEEKNYNKKAIMVWAMLFLIIFEHCIPILFFLLMNNRLLTCVWIIDNAFDIILFIYFLFSAYA